MSAKPNVIVIMTDQQRADCSGREGFALDTTPFMDALAAQGVAFSHAYTAAPVCGPARVSLMTGRYPSAHGVRENRGHRHARYGKDLIDVLRENGYKTAVAGKNHSHLSSERLDDWFELSHDAGYMYGQSRTAEEEAFDNWLHALNHGVATEPTPFPVACQGPYRAVSHAQQWIQEVKAQQAEQPFFLWLSFAEPHNPYQVPEPYFSLFPTDTLPPLATDEGAVAGKGFKWQFTHALQSHYDAGYSERLLRMRANYYGMLRLIDDQVNRLVTFLREEQLLDDTLLVFLSDHGDFTGEYGLMRKGPELPETLVRIPMFAIGPGIKGCVEPRREFVSLVDVMPTLCEAIGAALPPGVQGRSLWPLLQGRALPPEEFRSVYCEVGFGGLHYGWDDLPDYAHCAIEGPQRDSFDELNSYSQSGTLRMVRKGDWKLICDMQGNGQLYHLAEDPFELTNLYGNASVAAHQSELLAELVLWLLRMQDPLPYPEGKYRIKTHPRNYWTEAP